VPVDARGTLEYMKITKYKFKTTIRELFRLIDGDQSQYSPWEAEIRRHVFLCEMDCKTAYCMLWSHYKTCRDIKCKWECLSVRNVLLEGSSGATCDNRAHSNIVSSDHVSKKEAFGFHWP